MLVGSALKDIGVTQLLDAITAYMPSAEDARVTATNANGDEIEVVPGETLRPRCTYSRPLPIPTLGA